MSDITFSETQTFNLETRVGKVFRTTGRMGDEMATCTTDDLMTPDLETARRFHIGKLVKHLRSLSIQGLA